MGVSLSYTTDENVSAELRASVASESAIINCKRRWWCEPICFFDWPGREGKLAGDSKLFVLDYPSPDGVVELDPLEDLFLAMNDLLFIVRYLCKWSKSYSLSWRLDFAGDSIGGIEDGRPDKALANFLRDLETEHPELTFAPSARQDFEYKQLATKHKARWA